MSLCCYFSGPAIIISDQRIREGEWTKLMAERNQRDGSLSINGGVAVKGINDCIVTVAKQHVNLVYIYAMYYIFNS